MAAWCWRESDLTVQPLVSWAATGPAANRMATAGLLLRKPDPVDARLVRLYLTDQARAVRRAVEQERDGLERRMTATLTSTEREHLRSALIKIIAQLAGDPAPPRPPAAAVPGLDLRRPG